MVSTHLNRAGLSRCYKDKNDHWFDGSKHLQAPCPGKSTGETILVLTIYTTTSRKSITRRKMSISHRVMKVCVRTQRSTIRQPKAPAGYQKNWHQTNPGKAWFAYFRLYGPLEPYLNRSWKLSDFEEVK
jgi:hypothetical protein